MSDIQQGHDWWYAADGKWYPPVAQMAAPMGSPEVALPPPPPAPPQQPVGQWMSPQEAPSRDLSDTVARWGLGALVLVVVVAAAWFGWHQMNQVSVTAEVQVLGNVCSYDSYSDADQVVVKNPDGKEVAFATLDVYDDGPGHCAYRGEISWSDRSDYYLVGTRSERRSPLRIERSEIKKSGIGISLGDCTDALDLESDNALSDCLDFHLQGFAEAVAAENGG